MFAEKLMNLHAVGGNNMGDHFCNALYGFQL